MEEKKEIKHLTYKEWEEKAAELKEEYPSFNELRSDCIEIFTRENFHIEDMVELRSIFIQNYIQEIDRCQGIFYNETDDGKFVRVKADKKTVNEIIKKLAEQMDAKKFMKYVLRDALRDTHPSNIDEIYKELKKKDIKIKPKKGCVDLMVGKAKLHVR